MNDKYILDDNGRVVPEPDPMTWAAWFGANTEKRIVKQEYVGDVWISTVFLGLNHAFASDGPPVVWETMIRAQDYPDLDGWMDRCPGNKEQAEAMHQRAVEKVQEVLNIEK